MNIYYYWSINFNLKLQICVKYRKGLAVNLYKSASIRAINLRVPQWPTQSPLNSSLTVYSIIELDVKDFEHGSQTGDSAFQDYLIII